jgi:hypothetical protein
MKKQIIIPRNSEELEKLVVGDKVKLSYNYPYTDFLIYEGRINRKYAFMLQDKEKTRKIKSYRIEKKDIKFDYQGIILPENSFDVSYYSSRDSQYKDKKRELINSRLWVSFLDKEVYNAKAFIRNIRARIGSRL